ncbi:hypothetical protein [Frigidibacter sp. ROC022]|uniref:hypothetical protein n=1 Tax=Frigidibacter sp. ROC022 TaxID=2971796 RepID=UPI00215B56CE|nr:hypothetical protein [Frigidibacter sp. ROC022]MCR8722827.1 hypothetical protein [Frigidibacter sp. ROC022]
MTLFETIARGPVWVMVWLNWMLVGVVLLPALLLIWRPSRRAGLLTLLGAVAGGAAVTLMYQRMGYVRLLGLPHLVFWTPLAAYLFARLRRPGLPKLPRRIMAVTLATILISLAFDYADVLRYLLGERGPMVPTAPG